MPAIDLLTYLGSSRWAATDGARLQHALQRARYDLMGIASLRAVAGDIVAGNAEVKEALDGCPQFRGWVVVNPNYPERSAEQLRKYASYPQWLGAMLPIAETGGSLLSAATRDLVNAYRRYTKPLLVTVAGRETARELEAFAAEFSTLKIVAAGAGRDAWPDCLAAAKRAVNLFLEPCSGGAHRGKLEALLAGLGPNRVVYASGYPIRNPGSALGLVVDARISEGERNAVLSGNAIRLLGLRRAAEE